MNLLNEAISLILACFSLVLPTVVGLQQYSFNGYNNSNDYNSYNTVGYSNYNDKHDLFPDFPGPYCSQRNSCCNSRVDSCAVPISDTLCYCDDFCDRNHSADCCPDFLTFCKGAPPPPAPIVKCFHSGRYYDQFESFKDNCNVCKCTAKAKVECSTDTCLVDEALIDNVNRISDTWGWTARNYSEFWGRKYKEGLELRLGTKEPTYKVRAMTKLSNKMERLPRSFNAKENWPGLVSEVRDQEWCGSSWVISTTSVASDRFAIQSNGKELVQLAPQNILSCVRRQQGCNGGHLDVAWRYLLKQGVTDEECWPYQTSRDYCKTKRTHSLSDAGCTSPTTVGRDYLYTMGPAYSLNNETDIMIEILESGPVQATLKVYRDFFSYSGGVYRHSAASRDEESGFHSVRLVGWGEEYSGDKTVQYWIAANSWGYWWGENGYFRILRGQNECMIEDYVLASWPHVFDGIHHNSQRRI